MVQFILRGNLSHVFFGSTMWAKTKNTFRAMVDAATKKALSGIPLMKTKAGPRDKEVPSLNWRPSNMSRFGQPD